jgi:hypothetical protein
VALTISDVTITVRCIPLQGQLAQVSCQYSLLQAPVLGSRVWDLDDTTVASVQTVYTAVFAATQSLQYVIGAQTVTAHLDVLALDMTWDGTTTAVSAQVRPSTGDAPSTYMPVLPLAVATSVATLLSGLRTAIKASLGIS